MADYKGLLGRAIEALPENNGNARRKVYEKARSALVGQLRSIEPPLPAKEITKHRLELENCIREVEQEATEILLARLKEEEARRAEILAEKQRKEAEEKAAEEEAEKKAKEEAEAEARAKKEQQETEAALNEDLSEHANLPPVEEEPTEEELTEEELIEEEFAEGEVELSEQANNELASILNSSKTEDDAKEAETNQEIESSDSDDLISFIAPEGEPDDLKLISGVGPALEKKLNGLGIFKFEQIAALTKEEISRVDDALYFKGRIDRENWISQAVKLAKETDSDINDSATEIEAELGSEVEADLLDKTDEPSEAEAEAEPEAEPEPEPEPEPIDVSLDNISSPLKSEIASIDDVISEAKETTITPDVQSELEQNSGSSIDEKENYYPDDFPFVGNENELDGEEKNISEGDLDINAPDISLESDPQLTIDRAIKKLDQAARGENIEEEIDQNSATKLDGDNAQKIASEVKSGRGRGLTTFLVIFLLLLLLTGGAAYWAWRAGYVDVEALFGQQTAIVETNIAEDGVDNNPVVRDVIQNENTNEQTQQNTAPTPDAVAPISEQLVQNDAISEDNESNVVEPVTNTSDSLVNGNETIAAPQNDVVKSEERLTSEEQITPDETTIASTNNEVNSFPATNEQAANNVSNSAQSLLLEASSDGTTGAIPFSGSVKWSRDVDELGSPTIKAVANIPARNLGVELLIRRNSDASLPASHLMEVNFIASETFAGGSIEGLPGILLKNEELVQGTQLVGASARIVSNSFLFALSAAKQDINSNMKLLGERKWMDLALIYSNGKRAIITLEKDAAAQKMFEEVLKSWQEDTVSSNN